MSIRNISRACGVTATGLAIIGTGTARAVNLEDVIGRAERETTANSQLHGAAPDPNEPNDVFVNATPITCPGFISVDAAIDPGGDVDYFLLTGPPADRIAADIDAGILGSSLDAVLGVYDSFFVQLGLSDDDGAPGEPTNSDSYLQKTMPPDGELYVAVGAFADFDFDGGADSFFTGTYTLQVDCFPPPPAPLPDDLLASTGNRGDALIDIDPATGLGSFRALQGDFGSVTELEFGAAGNLLGATGGGADRLIDISPATGIEVFRCNHMPGALNGLEYVDGVLYGALVPSGGGVAPSDLVIVAEPDAGNCAITTVGATGFNNIGGLAYDANTDTLYGCTASELGGNLLTCDRTTGLCTDIGPTGFSDCAALEFGPDGVLYAGVGGTLAAAGSLLSVDTDTGLATLIGDSGFPVLSGLAFVPFVDGDGDGIQDSADNCLATANSDQLDADADFIGDACDADMDNNCHVDLADFSVVRPRSSVPDWLIDPAIGTGIDLSDPNVIKPLLFKPPGPSGVANLCSDILNTGQFAVTRNFGFDLDGGTETPGSGAATLNPPADLWFEEIDVDSAVLRPLNGSQVAAYGTAEPNVLDCINAPLADASIDLQLFSYTTYYCARTEDGRVSRFRIIGSSALPIGSAARFEVEFTTW